MTFGGQLLLFVSLAAGVARPRARPALAAGRAARRARRERRARRHLHAQRLDRPGRLARDPARPGAPALAPGAGRRARDRARCWRPASYRARRVERLRPARPDEPRAHLHVAGRARHVPRPSAHRRGPAGPEADLRPLQAAAGDRARRPPAQRAGPDRGQHGTRGARRLRAALRLAVRRRRARAAAHDRGAAGSRRGCAPASPRARRLPGRRALRVELRRRGAALPALHRWWAWPGPRAPGTPAPRGGDAARRGHRARRPHRDEGRAGPRLAHRHARRRARARAHRRHVPRGAHPHAGLEARLGLARARVAPHRHLVPAAPARRRAALPLVPAALPPRHRVLRPLRLRRRDLDQPRRGEGRRSRRPARST